MYNTIEEQVKSQIGDVMWYKMQRQTEESVWYNIRDEVEIKVEIQVWEQVQAQIQNKLKLIKGVKIAMLQDAIIEKKITKDDQMEDIKNALEGRYK